MAPESRPGQGASSPPWKSCASVASVQPDLPPGLGWMEESEPGVLRQPMILMQLRGNGRMEASRVELRWHKHLCPRRRVGSTSCRDEMRRGRGGKGICAFLEEGRGWKCGGVD